jgi:carbon-monoxide dehydrogenase large subunit
MSASRWRWWWATRWRRPRAGAAALEVEYEELPAVADTATALGHATALHAEAPDNRCYTWAIGDAPGTDAAFAQAAHVTALSFRNNRLIPNAIEPRAANASYDAAADSHTLYVSNQNPARRTPLDVRLRARIPEHKMRVIAPRRGRRLRQQDLPVRRGRRRW